jgi:hypothetical protein
VSGLKQLQERCRDAGYQVLEDEALPGYHRFYVDDPFGNRIEFLESI